MIGAPPGAIGRVLTQLATISLSVPAQGSPAAYSERSAAERPV
jgi:hypothetical protein